MWGNRLGWTISLGLVALTMLALWGLSRVHAPSWPTTVAKDPANLARLASPALPPMLAEVMSSPRDAASLYRRAIEAYRADPRNYERILRSRRIDPQQLSELKALEPLLQATPCQRMALFISTPEEVVGYGISESLAALEGVGKIAVLAGMMLRSGEPQRAREYYQAAFSLGAKLYEERVSYDEMAAGMGLMGESAQALLNLERQQGQQARAQSLADFIQSYLSYDRSRIKPIIGTIRSIDLKQIERHAGDVFAFATDSQERVWRVEATLQLGRLRFSAARVADQHGATRLLRKLTEDPDPAVRAAAIAAQNLTVEQYRMQGAN